MFLNRASELLSRGLITKPSRASAIAGPNSVRHGSLPCRRCARAASARLPGTPTLRPPGMARSCERAVPLTKNQSGPAARGAASRPSIVSTWPCASAVSRKPPPPIPELCGSTTPSASIVAMAASVADPPSRSIAAPASAARGSAAETAPPCCGATGAERAARCAGRAPTGVARITGASVARSSERIGPKVISAGYSLPIASAMLPKPSVRARAARPFTMVSASLGPW